MSVVVNYSHTLQVDLKTQVCKIRKYSIHTKLVGDDAEHKGCFLLEQLETHIDSLPQTLIKWQITEFHSDDDMQWLLQMPIEETI